MYKTRTGRIMQLGAILFLILVLAGCGGGGGGGGVDNDNNNGTNIVSSSGTGANGVPIFWKTYGNPTVNSGAASIQVASDGGFVAAGGQQNALYLVKTDALGVKQWEKTFGGGSSDVSDSANCIRKTSDGGYIIAGLHSSGIGGTETHSFYLVRTDALGNALAGWPKTYSGSSPDHNGAYAVCESQGASGPDGFVFVGSSIDHKAYIAKVDMNGALIKETFVDHDALPYQDAAAAIVQNADNGFTLAGWVEKGGTPNYIRIVRTDKDLTILPAWTKTYGVGSAYDIKKTSDGSYILAGTTSTGAPNAIGDALVIKLDSSGNELWRKTFGGAHDDVASSISPLNEGNDGYIVAGKTASYSSNTSTNEALMYEVFLIKLDKEGNTLWQKAKGIAPDSPESASEVQVTGDGGYVIAGVAQGRYMIAKMDANGDTVNLGQNDFTYTVPAVVGTINVTNALYVAGMGVSMMDNIREVGAFALDLLLNPSQIDGTKLKIDPVPATLKAGDLYHIVMDNYTTTYSGDSATLNGSMTVNIDSVTGTTYNLTVSDIDVIHEDDTGKLIEFKGGLKFTRTTSGSTASEKTQIDSSSGAITITVGGKVQTVDACIINRTQNSSLFNLGIAGDTMQFELADVPGTMVLNVINPIVGSVSDSVHPNSGDYLIKAPDNSSVTINITTGGVVKLEVDTNADGAIEGTISTTFDELD